MHYLSIIPYWPLMMIKWKQWGYNNSSMQHMIILTYSKENILVEDHAFLLSTSWLHPPPLTPPSGIDRLHREKTDLER
jgi:hypothetical protein